MKILEELWYGNVTPGERSVEKGSRLWNLGRLILQNEEELAPLLSEKAKEVLEKLRDNQSELNDLNECAVFVCATAYDAKSVLELCENRLSLIRSLAFGVDTSFADDAFFLRSGNTVVFCALEDNSSARAAWKRVLRAFA